MKENVSGCFFLNTVYTVIGIKSKMLYLYVYTCRYAIGMQNI